MPCLRLTRSRLHRVPQLVSDLEVSLARMAVLAERTEGGKSAEKALAYTEAAGDALRKMRGVLVGWTRLLHEELGVGLPRDGLVAMASHLSRHARRLVAHPAAAEWCDEVRLMVAEAVAVIDLPENRMRVTVGPCPEEYTGEHGGKEPCPGQVVAVIPNDEAVRPTMTCSACGAIWFPEQWTHAGSRILKRASAA